ncbi:MAG: WYL domain-containing protein [Planctomycetia bacterium]|nr:WYL domain-containing protein [Planctomycetia bacterium]
MDKPEERDEKKSVTNRVERILTILQLLQNGQYTQEELMERYTKYSVRTFYRDLEGIREFFGDLIQHDKQGKFYLQCEGAQYPRALDLTYIEALSLYLLCHMGKKSSRTIPYMDSVMSAMVKLRSLFQELLLKNIENQADHILLECGPMASHMDNQTVFSNLLFAHEKGYGVLIIYDSIYEGKEIETLLFPYFLHFTRHAWYVVGRSGLHQEIRTFHIERIRSVEVLKNCTFILPPGWTYEQYRGNAWNMIYDGPDIEVVLRFSKLVARNVMSVRWHKTQVLHYNSDGTLDFRVIVSGTREILWWILGYGAEVEVLAPESLRLEVIEHVRRLQKIYL